MAFCMQAHKLGMRYPKHLFLTYGTYESQWWTIEDDRSVEGELVCSAEDRASVLEFSLAASHYPSSRTANVYLALVLLCTV